MISLERAIARARTDHVAIAHFNVSEFASLKAVWEACRALSANAGRQIPVVIGVSEGEREFLGTAEIAGFVQGLRRRYGHPVYLNADHHRSLASCSAAIDAGFDAVILDAADKSFDENVALTRSVVAYARAARKRKVLVEGELGFIGTGSEVKDRLPDGVEISEDTITKPGEAARFVEATGVDLLAPAVGNAHGLFKASAGGKGFVKRLFIGRIDEIRRAAKVPLVLHGGSGTPDDDLVRAIDAGMRIVHVSTELRQAWRQGVERGFAAHVNEVAPYKLLEAAVADVKAVALQRLALFNKLG